MYLPTGGAAPPAAVPLGISENCTLFAFEEATPESPGRYLGEFGVVGVDPKPKLIDDNQNPQQKIQISAVKMQPAYPLSQEDVKKLAEAKGYWTFYSVLPQDEHEIFAKLTDEQKQKLFPVDFSKETLAEYLGDGKPADPNAPKDRIDAGGNYIRPLRNYSLIFDHCRQRKTILFDEAEATNRDMKLVEESLADAKRQVQFYQNLKTETAARLAKSEKDRDVVAKLCSDLEAKIKLIEDAIGELIKKNKAMAGELAEKQLEATRIIDARTRVMAQTASTGGEK
jgi:vacuolar-type H+-ATPase subunit I/STV1